MAADRSLNGLLYTPPTADGLLALADRTCERLGIPAQAAAPFRDQILASFISVLNAAADVAKAGAENYPLDIFPKGGQSQDVWAAEGCRLMSKNIAEDIHRLASETLFARAREDGH